MGIFQQKIEFASLGKKGHFTLFEQILAMLDGKMQEPNSFGWYHLLCLAIVVALCALIICKRKSFTPQRIRLNIGIAALLLILFEVYKQLNFSYNAESDRWGYQWYAFPFQFCSTPMYIGLLAGLTKKGKFHESLCAYLATYAIFAGTAVMVYPGNVFIETIGINIQTMICHGSMITIGIYLYATGYVKLSHKTILKAIPVFAVTLGMALIMNEVMYHSGWLNGEEFNMFYISPYFENFLPIYSDVHKAVPAPWNILIYSVGFTALAYLMLLIAMGIGKLFSKMPRKAAV